MTVKYYIEFILTPGLGCVKINGNEKERKILESALKRQQKVARRYKPLENGRAF